MSLTDPTGGAGYSTGEVLTSTHMTTIANQQPYALDGNGGGTYTPSAAIIVNGSGLTVGGNFTLKYGAVDAFAYDSSSGTITIKAFSATGSNVFSDECDFSSLLAVTASGSVNLASGSTVTDHAAWTIDGTHTISGGAWTYSGGASITGGAGAGAFTWNNAATLNGTTTIGGALSIAGTGSTLDTDLTATGGGFLNLKRTTVGASYALSLSGGSAHVATQAGQLFSMGSSSGTVTLDNDGAVGGSFVVFFQPPATATTLQYNWNGSSYATSLLMDTSTTGYYEWVILIFNGATWDIGPYKQW